MTSKKCHDSGIIIALKQFHTFFSPPPGQGKNLKIHVINVSFSSENILNLREIKNKIHTWI